MRKKQYQCKICKKDFIDYPSNKRIYCSQRCKIKSMIGSPGHWKGKIRYSMIGEKNHDWKGNNVGYRALHRWVERWAGKAEACKYCGAKKTTPKSIHWANISKKYLRNLTDWISLCAKCHKAFDKKMSNG